MNLEAQELGRYVPRSDEEVFERLGMSPWMAQSFREYAEDESRFMRIATAAAQRHREKVEREAAKEEVREFERPQRQSQRARGFETKHHEQMLARQNVERERALANLPP